MKIIKVSGLLICLCITLFLPKAQAAFFSITPTGSFDAEAMGATTVTYQIFFNVEPAESFEFISWDIIMQFDSVELTYLGAANILAGNITEISTSSLNYLFFSVNQATDVVFNVPGAYLLVTVTFEIRDPLRRFDGKPDFWVLSQIDDFFQGFTTREFEFLQFAGANGADVGFPLPVPNAAAVLGSVILLLLSTP